MAPNPQQQTCTLHSRSVKCHEVNSCVAFLLKTVSSYSAKQHNKYKISIPTRLRLLVVSSHLDKMSCLSGSTVDKQTPSSIVAQFGKQQNRSIY